MKLKILAGLLAILFLSCNNEPQEPISLNGTWESVGSGWLLQIQDSTQYSMFDITAISCVPTRQAELSEIIASIGIKNDTLMMTNGVMTYHFTRIKNVPEICGVQISDVKKNDPIYNFEVFAETVKDHYAFMELNAIDWDSLYREQKNKLIQDVSDPQLYTVIEETMELLNDNHRYLEATDEVYKALEELAKEEEIATDESLPEYGDFAVANLVSKHHIEKDMTTDDSWLISWGITDDRMGYIQVKAMWLFADLNIAKSRIEDLGYVDAYVKTFHEMDEGLFVKMEVEGVRKVMDKVMNDLKDTESIVVDLRFNGGGQDAVSFEILGRFNSEKRQIATTKLKYGNEFTPVRRLFLEPSSQPYTNPIYVLTSQQTGSAAEAFALGSISIPNIKRIGSHTQGALSTSLEKKLPNGWVFSISNEVYMDNHGISYENIGVPVDYDLNYPRERQTFFRWVANDLDRDKRNILGAIEVLKLE